MKMCLVVVDYQNDFVSGSLGFEKAAAIEENIVKKLEEYHRNGDKVVFTLDTHFENYMDTLEGKNLPVPHCIKYTDGHKLYGRVAELVSDKDRIFEKYTFGSDSLMEYMKSSQFDSVELVGVVTNICVISNAVIVKAALPEAEVSVDASCVASNDDSLNEKALDVMESFQIKVLNRKETL